MNKILLSEKNILEYICDTINDFKYSGKQLLNAKYHHNSDYKQAASICRHGILTLEDLNRYGIRNDLDEFLSIMNDVESHVNGKNSISLSVVGLKDLYRDEYEYNPFSPSLVDFLVTSDLKVARSSIHYGNEFLSYKSVKNIDLRSIDIRLLKLINLEKKHLDYSFVLSALEKYNSLIDIASEVKNQNLDIPLREMSDSNIYELDIDELSNQPKLVLKSK